MNATELADELENTYPFVGVMEIAATMLRQQQAEIEELEKENTDLRYLIATKLEQQNGISLNSMAHPVTNTPEPSYEIDLDKLETIEIDLPSPEPVAWIKQGKLGYPVLEFDKPFRYESYAIQNSPIPLYTHPVKELTLTKEEIHAVWASGEYYTLDKDGSIDEFHFADFARAILLKAQEK